MKALSNLEIMQFVPDIHITYVKPLNYRLRTLVVDIDVMIENNRETENDREIENVREIEKCQED